MVTLTQEDLTVIGFADVGAWSTFGDTISFKLDAERASVNDVLVDTPNALYAFVRGDAEGLSEQGEDSSRDLHCSGRVRKMMS